MFYIYILYSKKDHKLYTGFCDNLKRRVTKHNDGYVQSTKNRRPLQLIYAEIYLKKLDAKRREKYLKGGKGKAELKIQLKELFNELKYD